MGPQPMLQCKGAAFLLLPPGTKQDTRPRLLCSSHLSAPESPWAPVVP